MSKPIFYLAIVALLVSLTSPAQQSPSPQPTPCDKGIATQPHKQGWAEKKARAFACAQNKQLCDMPTSASDMTGATSDAKPCTSKTAPAPTVLPPQPAPVKLPPDATLTVTLRCNPLTPSTQGGAHQTTLTLPDQKALDLPKPGDVLADSVVPDIAAHVPCYLIKVDPTTGKSFIQR